VFDYILPIYFVKEIIAASCAIEELWGTNLSAAKWFDWRLVSVEAAVPAAFVPWDQTLQEWSEGGRTRRCKRGWSKGGRIRRCRRGLRSVAPDGASVVWGRWNQAVQAWSEGGGTGWCKHGLMAVEPDGSHCFAGRSLNLGPGKCWSPDRDVSWMAKWNWGRMGGGRLWLLG